MLTELYGTARFVAGLPGFLRKRPAEEAVRATLRRDLQDRSENFLSMLERAVFPFPERPYARLFAHAGLELGDVRRLVAAEGLEGALTVLHGAGIFLSLDEFKGRRPIRRGSLEITTGARDFDNPLGRPGITATSGGSRSEGTRLNVDLAHYGRDAHYIALERDTHGLAGRPAAMWRPPLPWGAGIKTMICSARAGILFDRWFAQYMTRFDRRGWKYAATTNAALTAARLAGCRIPFPEEVSLDRADIVARWLAEQKQRRGIAGILSCGPSAAIRVCLAAGDLGLDIADSVFLCGGEPLTDRRRAVMAHAGCRSVNRYSMVELGHIGLGCARPQVADEVHILLDKLALITRPKRMADGSIVEINVYTTLIPTPPRLLINLESDDYGTLERRACGCPLGALGYSLLFSRIRSYEKLTSEGLTFVGADLERLLEEALPQRFGGHPGDYQLVEYETAEGLPRVELVVSPRVGALDEKEACRAVIDFLSHLPRGGGPYGELWRQGGTLAVRRAEPRATRAAKIQPLHVERLPADGRG